MIKDGLRFLSDKFVLIGGKSDHHMLEVIKGASTGFVLRLLGAGLGFAFHVMLARMLGAEGAGLYFLAFSVATITTIFGRMGLDSTFVRFTAANASVGDWAAVKGLYKKGVSLALVVSFTASLIMFIGAPWMAGSVFSKPELAIMIQWMSLAIIPASLFMLHGELLRGLRRVRDFQLVRFVLVNLIAIPGIYFLSGVWGVKGAIWAYTISASLTALAGWLMWRRATPQLRGIQGRFPTDRLLQSSMPLLGTALLGLGMGSASTVLLGVWGSSAEVGVFAVAFRAAMLITLILFSFNAIIAPKFAALYRQGDIKAIRSTARNSIVLMALVACPVFFLFLLSPDRIMALFGPQFVGASTVLVVLAAGQFINTSTGSVGLLLTMSGHERVARNNAFFSMAANLALSLILIPRYGALGAAVAFSISLSLKNLHGVFLVQKHLSIKLWSFVEDSTTGPETVAERTETSAPGTST
jgi:O-antigen/teichoic acid export membrane protein